MKSVKAIREKPTADPRKNAALNPHQAADKAQTARNDAECNREPDAAKRALA